jgi:hypothetical protein
MGTTGSLFQQKAKAKWIDELDAGDEAVAPGPTDSVGSTNQLRPSPTVQNYALTASTTSIETLGMQGWLINLRIGNLALSEIMLDCGTERFVTINCRLKSWTCLVAISILPRFV